MNRQRDLIESYIPANPKFVILGTMCALNAREINGTYPEGDFTSFITYSERERTPFSTES